MKAKKMISVMTGALLSAALIAGSASAASMENGVLRAGEGKGEGYKIALLQQHQTNAFQIAVSEAAEAAAEELGVELTMLSADQDAATQISQIEQCAIEGYDAILFEPVDPDALGDAAKAAADEGVIVINIISACTNWEDYGIAALSCGDNVTAGETEMKEVAELIGGKGNDTFYYVEGVDVITDFKTGQDKIALKRSLVGKLSEGRLRAANFVANATVQIEYDKALRHP